MQRLIKSRSSLCRKICMGRASDLGNLETKERLRKPCPLIPIMMKHGAILENY